MKPQLVSAYKKRQTNVDFIFQINAKIYKNYFNAFVTSLAINITNIFGLSLNYDNNLILSSIDI